MNWNDLYLLREVARQRREAAVALRRVELAKGTEQYPVIVRRALLTMIEACPIVWGEGNETIGVEVSL